MPRRAIACVVAAAIVLAAPGGAADARRGKAAAQPVFSNVSDVTASATGGCGQSFCASVGFPFSVSESDGSSAQITTSCTASSGSTFPAGTTLVTCQAQDGAGALSQPVSFHVTVTVPGPSFQNVPGEMSTPATSSQGAVVTFVPPTAVDVAGQSATVGCDHQSGIAYPIGTTTVTCSATITRSDSVGNTVQFGSGSTQFSITVTPQSSGAGGATTPTTTTAVTTTSATTTSAATTTPATTPTTTTASPAGGGGTRSTTAPATTTAPGPATAPPAATPTQAATTADATPPTLRAHAPLRIDATVRSGATVTYAVLATDPDDGTAHITVSCTPASGSVFPLAAQARTSTTRVTCQAHDDAGNRGVPMSFAVTVVGAADQLTSLQAEVRAAALPAASKGPLLTLLTRASRRLHAGDGRDAATALASFIAGLGRLEHPRPAWSRDAARILALVS